MKTHPTPFAASGGGGRTIRPAVDPLSLGIYTLSGTRPRPESRDLAQRLAKGFGKEAPIVDRYLDALSYAPPEHLAILVRRRAHILLAPTIADALNSEWAATHRGRDLTPDELWTLKTAYSSAAGTAAVYEPALDVLVLPTSYAALDLERAVLHELGHALTMADATFRPALLRGLPPEIEVHVRNQAYSEGSDRESLRPRVFEALAEGYVFLVVGRAEELPHQLVSELMFILTTVSEGDGSRIRFDFDRETGRTATRVPPEAIADGRNPEMADLFAPRPGTDEPLEARDLGSDDLARHRRRRRVA